MYKCTTTKGYVINLKEKAYLGVNESINVNIDINLNV